MLLRKPVLILLGKIRFCFLRPPTILHFKSQLQILSLHITSPEDFFLSSLSFIQQQLFFTEEVPGIGLDAQDEVINIIQMIWGSEFSGCCIWVLSWETNWTVIKGKDFGTRLYCLKPISTTYELCALQYVT